MEVGSTHYKFYQASPLFSRAVKKIGAPGDEIKRFATGVGHSKHNGANFSLCLRVAQMPRSLTNGLNRCYPCCACVRGVNYVLLISHVMSCHVMSCHVHHKSTRMYCYKMDTSTMKHCLVQNPWRAVHTARPTYITATCSAQSRAIQIILRKCTALWGEPEQATDVYVASKTLATIYRFIHVRLIVLSSV